MRTWLLIGFVTFSFGCTNPGGGVGAPDMAAAGCVRQPGFKSDCGKPCDQGNDLGVGKFCQPSTAISDCQDNNAAWLCTALQDKTNFFCTMSCKMTGPPSQCGENARCACQGSQCGCFPTRCDTPSDGGMTD